MNIRQRLTHLRQLAESSSVEVRHFSKRNPTLTALWDALRESVSYERTNSELFRSPDQILLRGGGDVEDAAILTGACLTNLGIPWHLRVVRSAGRRHYHHVYVVATIDGEEVPFDTFCSDALGAEPTGETLDEEVHMSDELHETNAELADVKREAREASVNAIRRMMATLADSLRGGSLNGLPNLGLSSSRPYRAARVRGSGGRLARVRDVDFMSTPLARPKRPARHGKPALCINLRGQLVLAQIDHWGAVSETPVADTELLAEDAERLASALAGVLHAHIINATKTTKRFARMRDFSDKLNLALGVEGLTAGTSDDGDT